MKNFEVRFQYADEMSKGEWRRQGCSLYAKDERDAINKTIELYGLGFDCVYRIISVKEVGNND